MADNEQLFEEYVSAGVFKSYEENYIMSIQYYNKFVELRNNHFYLFQGN